MVIYIDSDCRCHADEGEGRRPFDLSFFDFKCRTFIEGYRYIPKDETWISEDGTQYTGEALFPFKDTNTLLTAQNDYLESFVREVQALYDEQS